MSADAAENDWLTGKLEELHRKFVASADLPEDVIAAWEAIRYIAKRNQGSTAPSPMPEWVNEYLLRSAEKIGRLCLGIEPENDKSIEQMVQDGDVIGALRKVRQADGKGTERFRDDRAKHLGAALGFTGKGWTAFQRHDHLERDENHLRIYDDRNLADNKPLLEEVRRRLREVVKKQESIDEGALRNRLSRARSRQRKRDANT